MPEISPIENKQQQPRSFEELEQMILDCDCETPKQRTEVLQALADMSSGCFTLLNLTSQYWASLSYEGSEGEERMPLADAFRIAYEAKFLEEDPSLVLKTEQDLAKKLVDGIAHLTSSAQQINIDGVIISGCVVDCNVFAADILNEARFEHELRTTCLNPEHGIAIIRKIFEWGNMHFRDAIRILACISQGSMDNLSQFVVEMFNIDDDQSDENPITRMLGVARLKSCGDTTLYVHLVTAQVLSILQDNDEDAIVYFLQECARHMQTMDSQTTEMEYN